MKTRTRVAVTMLAAAGIIAAGGGCAALASSGTPATTQAAASTQAATASTPKAATASTPKAATASTPKAATASTPKYVVLDCRLRPVVAPSTFVITCADAGMGVQGLHWTGWTPKLASGYGTFWENDCKPNCAEGHVHYYPSLEVLWGSAAVQGHPADRRYTELTVIFTGKRRPPVYMLKNGRLVATYPRTQTFGAI